jgi:hypothetical protein
MISVPESNVFDFKAFKAACLVSRQAHQERNAGLGQTIIDALMEGEDENAKSDSRRLLRKQLKTIRADVKRLPGTTSDADRAMFVDVLGLWIAAAPDTRQYKQGMHDLLAVLSAAFDDCEFAQPFALVQDIDALPEFRSCAKPVVFRLSEAHRSADLLTVFTLLMEHTQGLFEAPSPSPTSSAEQDSSLVGRIANVRALLHKYDHVLSTYLALMGAAPELFVVRWVRLLFSRETKSTADTLLLWDLLLSHLPSTPHVLECVVVVWLSAMRAVLLATPPARLLVDLAAPQALSGAARVSYVIRATQHVLDGSVKVLGGAPFPNAACAYEEFSNEYHHRFCTHDWVRFVEAKETNAEGHGLCDPLNERIPWRFPTDAAVFARYSTDQHVLQDKAARWEALRDDDKALREYLARRDWQAAE